ncbi:hypothetical protein OG883_44565 [Streptomyces sp. NBC_01142]|uniref:hypothetical protein n=1 Tax=Streptomyces sp. NBC_01142 TaxID=2975865 RepID=UPI00225A8874|nr:hypothetical protein [Streptomyces sp. NBC_01142]MCX4826719.1 hypothetical protein [Streptomyces sp. NBC_01142]
MRDSRLVQTAVIGDEHSDVPVVLPPEPIELDAFRHTHEGDTFWCGVLLGGCGAQLATKLYVDRQCHFQHFPQPNGMPNTCRRPAVGESSADHLYVKAAMSRSLLDHGRGARFAFPPPIGSLVDVDLEDGTSLRIHMDGSVRPDWDGTERTVLLGPGVVPDPGRLAGCPYVYRVRCDSDGANRRVWIGTQSLAHPTDWIPLSECTWNDEGLLTPTAARLLRTRPAGPSRAVAESVRPGAPTGALPESVVTFVRGLEAAQRTGTVEHVRRLCAGGDSLLQRLTPPVRAEAEKALAEARAWLATHEEYQRRLFAELEAAVSERRAWDVRSRLQQAAALTRRGASVSEERVLAAARSYLRGQDRVEEPRATAAYRREVSYRPAPPAPKKPKKPRPAAQKAKSQRRQEAASDARKLLKYLRREERSLSSAEMKRLVGNLARAAQTAGDVLEPKDRLAVVSWERKSERRQRAASDRAPSRKDRSRERPEHTQLDPLAHAVRAILQKAASAGTTLTWGQVRQQLPSGLPALERSEQTPLLIRVDRSRDSSAPLLSALVTDADHDMHPAYPRIADALGRPPASGHLAALAQWAVEVSRFQRKPAK